MATSNFVELASEVVAAYVSNNPLPRGDLPALIQGVHSAVEKLASVPEDARPQLETKPPAVPVRKSVTADYLICLEDGKKFKSLRRHLRGLGLTPVQYREKWNLPSDYPMVAPAYSASRSALAKQIGLGQLRKQGGKRKSERKPKAVQEKS
jgi:predicted transcriptional regulator